jgi:hypothetical protein
MVELDFDLKKMLRRVRGEVRALGEVIAQDAVCVLVRAALPWRMRVAEVNGRAERR